MIVVLPTRDSKRHDYTSSTCDCSPDVTIEGGEIKITHIQFDSTIETKWLTTDRIEKLQYRTVTLP